MEKDGPVGLIHIEEEPFAFSQLMEEKFGHSNPTPALDADELWMQRVRGPGEHLHLLLASYEHTIGNTTNMDRVPYGLP